MIAVHNSQRGFHPRWIEYIRQENIAYKLVDCYSNDIINQLEDCSILMWHHHHADPRDVLFAKQLLCSLEQAGKIVFPNFCTSWHFDDKLGQKYLLEGIKAPIVPSYVFYSRKDALRWIETTTFPKVFKTRKGAGSANVQLVKSLGQAKNLINRSFTEGVKLYDPWSNLQERWRKYKLGRTTLYDLLKGVGRLIYEPEYSHILGREKGYVYFQDFIPFNSFDIRIIVIDGKAFGLKRMVRANDFRASGSGDFKYAREEIDERCVRIAIDICHKLNAQCLAFDFIYDVADQPKVIEVSYGFVKEVYDPCPGFWNEDLKWIDGSFNPYGWMVDCVAKGIKGCHP
jgi:hypothetical protein